MAIPFNDLGRRFAQQQQRLVETMCAIVQTGVVIGGPVVKNFEENFAAACGTRFCVGVANGTDALELSLKACGVEPGDEVLTVANAGGYATSAILACAAQPVYVDIEPQQLQMNLDLISRALAPGTKAVILTHLFGVMNDVAALRKQLRDLGRDDVAIIEDCAQAHGAERILRAGAQGDVAAFSFYPTKNLGALGDAGALVTQSSQIAERARMLHQYGWSPKYHIEVRGGRNSRIDPLQAAFIDAQLGSLDLWNERRREICRFYSVHLPDGFRLVGTADRSFVGHLAVVIAPDASARDILRARLCNAQIGFDIHYPVLDCEQTGWRQIGRCIGELPVSRMMVERILSIPCFPELTNAEIEEIGHVLRG